MNTNDDGKSVVDMDCACGQRKGRHTCSGNLYIQPDKIDGDDCFMVTVIDTSGNEEGSLWLSPKQIEQLIKELKILLKG
jgi:hypothetical protein